MGRSDSHLEIDYDEFNETVLERIVALKDIISPMRRYKIESAAFKTIDTARSAGFYLGQFGYVMASSMILLMLPLAFEMQKDADLKSQLPDVENRELLQGLDE
eukprot:NODE_612_length_6011_cov_0.245095.p4 type:complete len:103 gc:universal NODE_612_length_6011_cov_0.245095:4332-4640(+)